MRVFERIRVFVVVSAFAFVPLPAFAADGICTASPAGGVPGPESLTLMAAVQAALRHHPDLIVAECEIQAARGRRVQAGLRPNPQAGIEIANVAGTGAKREYEAAETTLNVEQLIELGGKRGKRVAVAETEINLADLEREAKRLEVVAESRKAYIGVLAAQERVALFGELSNLSKEVLRGVAARVVAGKVSPPEELRAGVAVNLADLALADAQAQLETARSRLAASWGAEHAAFTLAAGDLTVLPQRPSLARIEDSLPNNPDLARWITEADFRQRTLNLAEAEGVPDLTVSAGVRQFSETDDVGLVVGLSVPIPLFNRNQGAIAAARAHLSAVAAGRGESRLQLLDLAREQYRVLASADTEVRVLKEKVLPSAQKVFEATTAGFKQGKFSYLEALDAQRTLFETRSQYVDALARYQIAVAELERLTGAGLNDVAHERHDADPGAKE